MIPKNKEIDTSVPEKVKKGGRCVSYQGGKDL